MDKFQIKRKLSYIRFCIFLFVLILTCALNISNLTSSNSLAIGDDGANSARILHAQRHILSVHVTESESETSRNNTHGLDGTRQTAKCVRPDIEQFPKDFFSQAQRSHGAILIHFAVSLYMFIALAVVCDEYFVPSLNMICKRLNLKEDVAGATFMAAGSSAPELATTIISLFIAKDVDIGIGTVVGSAVFNIMFVISIVALLSGIIISLNWYPMLRDSVCYLISILAMILVIVDDKVYLYEAIIFLVLYAFYIVVMVFNTRIEEWCYLHLQFLKLPDKRDVIPLEGSNYETLRDEPFRSQFTSSSSINMMTSNQPENVPNGAKQIDEDKKPASSPFEKPAPNASTVEKLRYYICLPIVFVLHYTIPNSQSESSKLYLISFSMSLVWLSIFSYIMVWMITVIGFTFRIPDTVMGITLIAFGASVPDALSSLLVAKSGLGDMAVSNAIGSNVFDILVCLGIPWLIRCITMQDKFISVKSKGLTYSSVTLFGTVLILILSIHFNKWQLNKRLGVFLMIVYILFITLSSLYELNIIGSNHLPMCTDGNW